MFKQFTGGNTPSGGSNTPSGGLSGKESFSDNSKHMLDQLSDSELSHIVEHMAKSNSNSGGSSFESELSNSPFPQSSL